MRHFRSILYAIVLAPTVWVLVAAGLTHDLTARGRDGFAVESGTGLALLVLGGAAYGILVFAPISPLGPAVAGVVFLVAGVWAVASPSGYAGRWPSGLVKEGFDLSRPGYGLAALLAVPLILTVLSVRRWSGFEPVVLPIIGPVGRARGAAALAGLPVSQADTFRASGADERTSLIRMPGADAAPEATTVLSRPVEHDGDTTTVLRAPAVAGESATEDVAAGNEEPTDAIADERPTGDVLDEPPTVAVAAGNDEPTDAVADEQATEDVAGSAGGEPTVSLDDDEATEPNRPVEEPTEVIAASSGDEATEAVDPATEAVDPAADEETAVVVSPPAADEEVTVVSEAAEAEDADEVVATEAADGQADIAEPDEQTAPTEAVAAADEASVDDEAATDDEPVTSLIVLTEEEQSAGDDDENVVLVEDTTYLLVPADDDAQTQRIRLAAELAADGERTQVIRPVGYEPGQTTRDLRTPGEHTQVISPSAHRVPGETTQAIGLPGEKTRRIVRSGETVAGQDETQVIRLPDPADDGARTQVIRPGRVTPPGDDAEQVRLPRQRVDSDQLPGEPEEPTEPGTPPSIARAESPNFAEDPTGRIVSPILPPDEPTRTMTVMNIERPPDDTPEIPTQRKPPADG